MNLGNLLCVTVVALVAPLLVGAFPRVRVPSVVLEIVAGIVLGPSVLNWVKVDPPVEILALVGLAFLLLLAGLEIDLRELRGRALRMALGAFAITLVLGSVVGAAASHAGWAQSGGLVAIALAATSLGLVVPVLKDAGQVTGPIGQTTIAAASVADFGAIVLLSVLFSMSAGSVQSKVGQLVGFAGLVALVAVVVVAAGRSTWLGGLLFRLQDTTAEIRVRATVVLLIAFVALASRFGLENILGAFVAGAVIAMADRDATNHPAFRPKLEAIGFGFLVPVFFVTSGLRLDLAGLFAHPLSLIRVPVFVVALLLVRGLPALLHLRDLGHRQTLAVALMQATSLPFIVTATQIGASLGLIDPLTSAALVTSGLISVLVFPAFALSLLRAGAPANA